jgi:hypothetical protein
MENNIWKNDKYQNAMKLYEKEQEELAKKFEWFTNIIKEEVTNIVGELSELNFQYDLDDRDGRWFTSKICVNIKNESAFDISLDKNNKLILFHPFSNMDLNRVGEYIKTIKLDSEPIFRDYSRQMINHYLIPLVKTCYKAHVLKNMPNKLKNEMKKIDLSIVTPEWFKNIFNSITEDEMNGEEAKKVKIEKIDNGVKINFTMNCNRHGYYKNNHVEINDRGEIHCDFFETPVEGAIEHELEKRILKEIQK